MTYIYEQISTNEIADRLYRDDNGGWSIDGSKVMAEFLENMAEEAGQPMELDIIAIRCDWSEQDLKTILSDFDLETLGELEENTIVLHVKDDIYIYQSF